MSTPPIAPAHGHNLPATHAEAITYLRSHAHAPRGLWDQALANCTPEQAWATVSLSTAPLPLVRDWLLTPEASLVTEARLRTMLNGWHTREAHLVEAGHSTRATQFVWHLIDTDLRPLGKLPRWADLLPQVLTDPRALAYLATHPDPRIRRRTATNTHLPHAALSTLMADSDALVRRNASETFTGHLLAAG